MADPPFDASTPTGDTPESVGPGVPAEGPDPAELSGIIALVAGPEVHADGWAANRALDLADRAVQAHGGALLVDLSQHGSAFGDHDHTPPGFGDWAAFGASFQFVRAARASGADFVGAGVPVPDVDEAYAKRPWEKLQERAGPVFLYTDAPAHQAILDGVDGVVLLASEAEEDGAVDWAGGHTVLATWVVPAADSPEAEVEAVPEADSSQETPPEEPSAAESTDEHPAEPVGPPAALASPSDDALLDDAALDDAGLDSAGLDNAGLDFSLDRSPSGDLVVNLDEEPDEGFDAEPPVASGEPAVAPELPDLAGPADTEPEIGGLEVEPEWPELDNPMVVRAPGEVDPESLISTDVEEAAGLEFADDFPDVEELTVAEGPLVPDSGFGGEESTQDPTEPVGVASPEDGPPGWADMGPDPERARGMFPEDEPPDVPAPDLDTEVADPPPVDAATAPDVAGPEETEPLPWEEPAAEAPQPPAIPTAAVTRTRTRPRGPRPLLVVLFILLLAAIAILSWTGLLDVPGLEFLNGGSP